MRFSRRWMRSFIFSLHLKLYVKIRLYSLYVLGEETSRIMDIFLKKRLFIFFDTWAAKTRAGARRRQKQINCKNRLKNHLMWAETENQMISSMFSISLLHLVIVVRQTGHLSVMWKLIPSFSFPFLVQENIWVPNSCYLLLVNKFLIYFLDFLVQR